MNRGFTPFGGFGRPRFRPFPHPFFPGRFLFPFFFFSPFFFPFFREGDETGEDRNDATFATHQAQPGQTLQQVAHQYNIPAPILEEANSHITNPQQLKAGESVVIPRISHMYCHKTYMERDTPQGIGNVAGAGSMAPGTMPPGMMPPGTMGPGTMGGSGTMAPSSNQAIPIPWQQPRVPYPYPYNY